MKLAVCNEFFEGWKIEDVFNYAAEIGCDGVEIAPFTLAENVNRITATRRSNIRKAADKAGVEIVGLHWLLASPKGLYLTHPDPAIRKKTQEYIKSLINFCGDLGGKVMIHGSPAQRNIQKGWNREECWKYAVDVFAGCTKEMQKNNVTYCIEALTPKETNILNSIAEAKQLIADVDHPNFQTMVDTKAAVAENKPHVDVIAEAGKAMRHVHVNDPNLRGPGFGDLKFASILRALKDRHYDGYVSVEVFNFKPDPQTIAARSIGYLKGIIEGLEG
jgi:sugar phosphate isomerase/epimerase